MQVPNFPQIPYPDGSLSSMQMALVTVIQVLNLVIGATAQVQSGGTAKKVNRNMAHTFIQDTQPTALNTGDLWLSTAGQPWTFSIWDGDNNRWLKLLDVPAQ